MNEGTLAGRVRVLLAIVALAAGLGAVTFIAFRQTFLQATNQSQRSGAPTIAILAVALAVGTNLATIPLAFLLLGGLRRVGLDPARDTIIAIGREVRGENLIFDYDQIPYAQIFAHANDVVWVGRYFIGVAEGKIGSVALAAFFRRGGRLRLALPDTRNDDLLRMMALSRTESSRSVPDRVAYIRRMIDSTVDALVTGARDGGADGSQMTLVHLDVPPPYFLLTGGRAEAFFSTYELTTPTRGRMPVRCLDSRYDPAFRRFVAAECDRIFEKGAIGRVERPNSLGSG